MLSVITSLDWFIIKKGPEDRGRGEVDGRGCCTNTDS